MSRPETCDLAPVSWTQVALVTCLAALLLTTLLRVPDGTRDEEDDPIANRLRQAFLEAVMTNKTMWSVALTPARREKAAAPMVEDPPLELPPAADRGADHGWRQYGMNMSLSDQLPLRRSLPDTRVDGCARLQYPCHLPPASVVIVFHNEGLSVLMRTVQSVLDRSPAHLLQELVLVDDYSDIDELGAPLESMMASSARVRLLRLPRREGLIRAKIFGALTAAAEVVVFLDAHCEVNQGWLEPLLAVVGENRRTIAVPVLDGIDSRSFQYGPLHGATGGLTRGLLDWALRYKERLLTAAERRHRRSQTETYSTATHSGGVFAISRWWFCYLGGYDPQLLGWGAENMELSFKTWMCGGGIQLVPCSRVGHVYRDRAPYNFGSLVTRRAGPIISQNFLRVASVWMDNHLEHFLSEEPASRHIDAGDLTDQLRMRRLLGCRSFDWYLANTVPEMTEIYPAPAATVQWGQLEHSSSGRCLAPGSLLHPGVPTLTLAECDTGAGPREIFRLSASGRLVLGELCAGFMPATDAIVLFPCPKQLDLMTWTFHQNNGTLEHQMLRRCLTTTAALSDGATVTPPAKLTLSVCGAAQTSQEFRWRRPSAVTGGALAPLSWLTEKLSGIAWSA